MAKKHFLQLAQTLNVKKHPVAGKFLSEKLDGVRFFWDGGATRGLPVEVIPWANIEKSNHVPISTGLWSRYGKVFNAQDWWLDLLPPFPVEGELWLGRGRFQELVSIVKSSVNQRDWTGVKAMVFDIPHPESVFADREINETQFKKIIRGALAFYLKHGGVNKLGATTPFMSRYRWLELNLQTNNVLQLHEQHRLPFATGPAIDFINDFTANLLELGAEGSIVKSGNDIWTPERVYSVLKYKPFEDGEAEVIGYNWGRETDKGSKLLGLMGSLICKINAGTFSVSGFTDQEREMVYVASGESAFGEGCARPGEIATHNVFNPKFPRGSIITYKYRELTDANLPKEARYWRPRAD